MFPSRIVSVAVAFLLLASASLNASSDEVTPTALEVPLKVRNPVSEPLVNEPVSVGVPLPMSRGLKDVGNLRLLDDKGKPVPAQFTPLARWGGAPVDGDRPIRWLMVDFQADAPAGALVAYTLVDGGGRKPKYPKLVLRERNKAVVVVAGSTKFKISKNDGKLTIRKPSATLAGLAEGGDGKTYTHGGVVDVSVALEGKMRVSVVVKGSYVNGGDKLVDYTCRYWFYAGKPMVRVFHTVENNRPSVLAEYEQLANHNIGSARSVDIADLSLVLTAKLNGNLSYSLPDRSGALDGRLVLHQESSGTSSWDKYPDLEDWDGNPIDARPRMQAYARYRGYRVTLDGRRIRSGRQAKGWLGVGNGQDTWYVGVRDFWKNFPKALRADGNGRIEIGLFPDEYGPSGYAFNLRTGEHKTHEIVIAAGDSPPEAALAEPFTRTPPEWCVNSGAFGLTAKPQSDWSEHEGYLANQLDTSADRTGLEHLYKNIFDAIEKSDFYGIFDYGDWPIDYEGLLVAPLNCKYDYDRGMWQQWARRADQRWFTLAEAADRHFADIDILHNLHSPRHWGDGIAWGHSYHDEYGLTNPHRNEGGSHPDTAYGETGMLLTYYITGYEKAYESAIELADCIEYRVSNDDHLRKYFPSGNDQGYALMDGLYDSGSRPAANCLSIAVAAYRATAEDRYLRVADAIVDWAHPSAQPYIGGGGNVMMKPWLLNMYLLALADYMEMLEEYGLEDESDARGSYIEYADFLLENVLLDIPAIDTGERAAYPYEWYTDGRAANREPSVNNWLLLGADAMAYAYLLSGQNKYLDAAERLFRAGTRDPFFEGDPSCYSETKQAINSIAYGHLFLYAWANK